MEYRFSLDEYVKVWKRTYFTVEADSEKEAIQKYLDNQTYMSEDSIYLGETEERIEPDNEPTAELFAQDYRLLWTNKK